MPEAQPAAKGAQDPSPAPDGKDPAQATPKPDSKGGSIYDDLGVDPPGKEGSTAWPDSWRKEFAGGDDKVAKQFDRFQNPAEVAKSWLAAQQRLRSGEYKRVTEMPAADAPPEQLDAWREENGIPKEAAGYAMPKVEGLDLENLDEATKGNLDFIRTELHKAHVPQAMFENFTQATLALAKRQAEAQATADAKLRDTAEDTLRADWGKDFRANLSANVAALEKHMGDDADAVFTARLDDGRKLMDIPAFAKMLNALARAEGGDLLMDGDDTATGGSVESQIDEIRKVMNTDMTKYWAEGLDKKMQKLLEIQEKRGKL